MLYVCAFFFFSEVYFVVVPYLLAYLIYAQASHFFPLLSTSPHYLTPYSHAWVFRLLWALLPLIKAPQSVLIKAGKEKERIEIISNYGKEGEDIQLALHSKNSKKDKIKNLKQKNNLETPI